MLCFAYEGKGIGEILHMQFYVSEYSLTYSNMAFHTYRNKSERKPGYTFLFSFLLTSMVPPMWGDAPSGGRRDNTPLKFLINFPFFKPLEFFSQIFRNSDPFKISSNFSVFKLPISLSSHSSIHSYNCEEVLFIQGKALPCVINT